MSFTTEQAFHLHTTNIEAIQYRLVSDGFKTGIAFEIALTFVEHPDWYARYQSLRLKGLSPVDAVDISRGLKKLNSVFGR